jgi:superfamily I DNA/RNA helicase
MMTRAEYFKASRKGRGVALTRKQRTEIWPVFEELRTQLHQQGLRTFEDATLDAADILNNQKIALPYRSIIVDEAQDMGPEALTLIRQLVPEQPNDIFIVGDGHQRIYRRKTTMGSCGIKIVGRSRKLRINYRTTEETRRFATAVLEDIAVDDLDGGEDACNDYRSLMHGTAPEVLGFDNLADEAKGIENKIQALHASGELLRDICVTARTKRIRNQLAEQFASLGLDTVTLEQQNDNRSISGIRLATMHRVKGLEFRYVFIASVNAGVIPLKAATSGTEDPVETRQRDLNERALLHVAATRAIKSLTISYVSNPSPYLQQ